MRVLATAAGSFSLAVFAANCIPLLEGALLPLSCVLAALCAAALLCLRGRARVRGALICVEVVEVELDRVQIYQHFISSLCFSLRLRR